MGHPATRYMTLETIAPLSDDPAMRLPGNRPARPANAVSYRQLGDTIMATFMVTQSHLQNCGSALNFRL
jgi:hypothetical protein